MKCVCVCVGGAETGSIKGRSRNDSWRNGILGAGSREKINAKRREKRKERTRTRTLYNSTHRIMRELGINREATLQTEKELAPMGQKLKRGCKET